VNVRTRLYTAIDGDVPDRVPVVPKIWVDLASQLLGTDLTEVVTDPLAALRVIAEAGLVCRVDAVRQFHFPQRKILKEDDKIIEVGPANERLGEIDMQGGLMTHLDNVESVTVEEPLFMAYNHYWTADEPFVKNHEDAMCIAIPGKHLYEELGCGDRQRRIFELFGEQLCFIGDCDSATMAFLVTMRGMNRALFDLIEQPRLVHAIMEKGAAIAIEKGKFNIDLGLKILRLNDSVGNMSVISPEHWRRFVFPHMKEVCAALHAYDPEVRIYCHICGNILPIVEDLVETGLDCIGPLDPLGNFTPAQVRERVGEAVSLMGGVNTLTFLNGTPERILGESIACMHQAGVRGGYILGSGCVVPRDADRKNLLALREAAETYGTYENGQLKKA
jgi:hypothetical protein